jgi:hypothetical protein
MLRWHRGAGTYSLTVLIGDDRVSDDAARSSEGPIAVTRGGAHHEDFEAPGGYLKIKVVGADGADSVQPAWAWAGDFGHEIRNAVATSLALASGRLTSTVGP